MTPLLTATRMATAPDQQLVARLRAGDDGALAALFTRHAETLLRLAYRITGSQEDAEDVVQDVFLGLRVALHRYEERETLAGWLRRVTARRALMHLRAERRTAARAAASAPPPASSQGDDLAAMTIALQDAVRALPDGLRHVFVLADIEGFSHAEIAELLGITILASRTRRHRAVALLQSALRTDR